MEVVDDRRIAEIRHRLGHPIVDADAHIIEAFPVFLAGLQEILDPTAVDDFRRSRYHTLYSGVGDSAPMNDQARRHVWQVAPAWWGAPANTPDRVAAYFPEKMYERIGIDHAVVYPSLGLMLPRLPEAELRQASCRALNNYLARESADHHERLTFVATIPTVTPGEAIEELEHAVGVLGMKAIMIDSSVDRVVPAFSRHYDELGTRVSRWDTYGIDSAFDYDPFWGRCVDLGVAVTAHGGSWGTTLHLSVSSLTYNHIEHFAAAGQALATSLVLGGVTRRFPTPNIACLEGGAAWGVSLLHSLVEHGEVRGLPGLERIDPRRVDESAVRALLDSVRDPAWHDPALRDLVALADARAPEQLNDFAACAASSADDVRALFASRFWFGCEAEDPGAAWALQPLHCLHAMFGSDIGHFDVPDMTSVIPAAWSLVTDVLMTEEQFGEYMFANVVRLHGGMNGCFLDGTTVAADARRLLGPTADVSPSPSTPP